MIIVLGWNYVEGTDSILDILFKNKEFNSVKEISLLSGVPIATLSRKLSSLREQGVLVSYRYKENNSIWLIGNDAVEKWNKYEALEIAKSRCYPEFEDEEDLAVISPFDKDRVSAVYFAKVNRLLRNPKLDIEDELHIYVDRLWELYKEQA